MLSKISDIVSTKNIVLLIDVNPVIASELSKLLIDDNHFPRICFRKDHPSLSTQDTDILSSLGVEVVLFDWETADLSYLFEDVIKVLIFSEVGTSLENLEKETELLLLYAQQAQVQQIVKSVYLGFEQTHSKSNMTLKENKSSISTCVVKHSSFMQNFLVDGIKTTKSFSLPFRDDTKISWVRTRSVLEESLKPSSRETRFNFLVFQN